MKEYFQDKLYGNNCYGCGAWNEKGLRIKSFWDKEISICIFQQQLNNLIFLTLQLMGISKKLDFHF